MEGLNLALAAARAMKTILPRGPKRKVESDGLEGLAAMRALASLQVVSAVASPPLADLLHAARRRVPQLLLAVVP